MQASCGKCDHRFIDGEDAYVDTYRTIEVINEEVTFLDVAVVLCTLCAEEDDDGQEHPPDIP